LNETERKKNQMLIKSKSIKDITLFTLIILNIHSANMMGSKEAKLIILFINAFNFEAYGRICLAGNAMKQFIYH